MAERSFPDALNQQIANEFGASNQYVGAAVYYDQETLPASPPSSTARPPRSATTR